MKNSLARCFLFLSILLVAAAGMTAAQASELDDMRKQGVVVERFDGFLEPREDNAAANIRTLVESINTKRSRIYKERAAENNVPASEVGKLYAIEIYEDAPSGTYFKDADGKIVRKE